MEWRGGEEGGARERGPVELGGSRSGLQVGPWRELLTHREGCQGHGPAASEFCFFLEINNARVERIKIQKRKWFMSAEGSGWVGRPCQEGVGYRAGESPSDR